MTLLPLQYLRLSVIYLCLNHHTLKCGGRIHKPKRHTTESKFSKGSGKVRLSFARSGYYKHSRNREGTPIIDSGPRKGFCRKAGRTTRNDDLLPDKGVTTSYSDGGGTGTDAPLVSESSSNTGSIVSRAAFSTCGTSLEVVSAW